MSDPTVPGPARAAQRRHLLRAGFAFGGAAALAPATWQPAQAAATTDARAAMAPKGLSAAPSSMAGSSPRLTLHAIDTFHGATGAGLGVELSRFEDDGRWRSIKSVRAVAGGRPADPLLVGDEYREGRYEVLLRLGEYFAQMGAKLPAPPFLSEVPLRFVIRDASQRAHLAALFSPWGYSYYRGS